MKTVQSKGPRTSFLCLCFFHFFLMNAILTFRLVCAYWNVFCVCHQIRTTHNSFARQTLFEFDSKKAEKDDDVFHFVRQEASAFSSLADPCRIPLLKRQLSSVPDPPDSSSSFDPDPDPGGQSQNDPQKQKKLRNFMFGSAGCSLLRAEGFSCSLDVLYGGLGKSKLKFLNKKIQTFFKAVNFSNFWSSKPWIRIGSGSGLNESVSESLQLRQIEEYFCRHKDAAGQIAVGRPVCYWYSQNCVPRDVLFSILFSS